MMAFQRTVCYDALSDPHKRGVAVADPPECAEREVSAFLKRGKELISLGPRHRSIWPTAKNVDTWSNLGLTHRQIFDIISSLSPRDFCAGPEYADDPTRGYVVWKFGFDIEADRAPIYIKLAIQEDVLVCLSFHWAEYPLRRPFRSTCNTAKETNEGGGNHDED